MSDISPEEGWADLLEELGDADSPFYTQCLHNFCKLPFGSKRYYLWGAGIGTVDVYRGANGRKKAGHRSCGCPVGGFGIFMRPACCICTCTAAFGQTPTCPAWSGISTPILAAGWFSGAMLLANLSLAAPTPRNRKRTQARRCSGGVLCGLGPTSAGPYYIRALVPPFSFEATQRFNEDRAFSQPATGLRRRWTWTRTATGCAWFWARA